jgi:hypothetical protein
MSQQLQRHQAIPNFSQKPFTPQLLLILTPATRSFNPQPLSLNNQACSLAPNFAQAEQ